jgi:hypothetical protein
MASDPEGVFPHRRVGEGTMEDLQRELEILQAKIKLQVSEIV